MLLKHLNLLTLLESHSMVAEGNYLQGKAAANVDRGLAIYNLMDAAGYDAAAMGTREFFYADATTGMIYHANLHKYYTQAELLRGAEAQEYRINAPWAPEAVMDNRDAKDAAAFKVVSSNVTKGEESTGYYDFDASASFFDGAVTVCALTDTAVPSLLQDDFAKGYTFGDPSAVKFGDGISVCLNNSGAEVKGATVTVSITNDGKAVCGVYVIDNATKAVTEEKLPDVTPDADVTREQAAAFMQRYVSLQKYDVSAKNDLASFTDAVSVSSWAKADMEWAVGAGLITGMTKTTIAPQGTATRAQVATILMRFCETVVK